MSQAFTHCNKIPQSAWLRHRMDHIERRESMLQPLHCRPFLSLALMHTSRETRLHELAQTCPRIPSRVRSAQGPTVRVPMQRSRQPDGWAVARWSDDRSNSFPLTCSAGRFVLSFSSTTCFDCEVCVCAIAADVNLVLLMADAADCAARSGWDVRLGHQQLELWLMPARLQHKRHGGKL